MEEEEECQSEWQKRDEGEGREGPGSATTHHDHSKAARVSSDGMEGVRGAAATTRRQASMALTADGGGIES